MRFSIDDGIAPANDGADHFAELGAAEAALGALIEQAVEQALAFSKQTGSASAEVPRVLVDASMGWASRGKPCALWRACFNRDRSFGWRCRPWPSPKRQRWRSIEAAKT